MLRSSQSVTDLLNAWGGGDRAAFDRLVPVVYEELRRHASRYLRRERPGQTLQTEIDLERSKVVDLRFFAGLSVEDTAEALLSRPELLSTVGALRTLGCAGRLAKMDQVRADMMPAFDNRSGTASGRVKSE